MQERLSRAAQDAKAEAGIQVFDDLLDSTLAEEINLKLRKIIRDI